MSVLDSYELHRHIDKFLEVLGSQLRLAGEVPAAFAIMTVDVVDLDKVQFNILTGTCRELLPKGREEVERGLHEFLRNWEAVNYPDRFPFAASGKWEH